MFHYSGYWRTWNKVLNTNGRTVTEIALTPINGWRAHDAKEQLWPPRVRTHSTEFNPRTDKSAVRLPPEVRAEMVEHLGEELTNRLLAFNLTSSVKEAA